MKLSIHDIYDVVSSRFRKRRIQRFLDVLKPAADMNILDVGGYPWFWLNAAVTAKITLLNPHVIPGLSERFSDRFEFVVIDGPPTLGLADAPLLAAAAGNVVFVIESGRTRTAAAVESLNRLDWGIYAAPKAEGKAAGGGGIPREERIEQFGLRNLWALWPTKLTLAPLVSSKVVEQIKRLIKKPGRRRSRCVTAPTTSA